MLGAVESHPSILALVLLGIWLGLLDGLVLLKLAAS